MEQAIEAAGVEFDGIVGAHLVAAVTSDAFFGVDPGRGCICYGDDVHGAGIPAGSAGHAL